MLPLRKIDTWSLPDWLTNRKEKTFIDGKEKMLYMDMDAMLGLLIRNAKDQYVINDELEAKNLLLEARLAAIEKSYGK